MQILGCVRRSHNVRIRKDYGMVDQLSLSPPWCNRKMRELSGRHANGVPDPITHLLSDIEGFPPCPWVWLRQRTLSQTRQGNRVC